MRIIIWYLGHLFISYQCIHIIMNLWSYCMCLSLFSLGSATSVNHVMPVCYRLLANSKLNLQTRKFANIQFATGTISLSFHHVYYSRIINIHIIQIWHFGERDINFYCTLENDIARGASLGQYHFPECNKNWYCAKPKCHICFIICLLLILKPDWSIAGHGAILDVNMLTNTNMHKIQLYFQKKITNRTLSSVQYRFPHSKYILTIKGMSGWLNFAICIIRLLVH